LFGDKSYLLVVYFTTLLAAPVSTAPNDRMIDAIDDMADWRTILSILWRVCYRPDPLHITAETAQSVW